MTATNDKWVRTEADDLAEFLTSIGWQSRNDAQWTRLREALPQIRALLAAAPQPPGDEAVAWMATDPDTGDRWVTRRAGERDGWAGLGRTITPLFTHPAPDAALHSARTEGERARAAFIAGYTQGAHDHTDVRLNPAELGVDAREAADFAGYNTTPPAPLAPARITAKELQVALGLKQHASDPDLMIGKYDDNIVSKDALEAAASALSAKSGGVVEVTDAMVIAAWNACAPGKNNIDANDAIYMRTAIRAALTAALTPGAKGEGT
jgi:hypothetical protein